VHPGGRKRVYQALAGELAALEPPVWAGLIASYARGRGLSVEIIDAEANDLSPAEVAEQVADRSPTLVAIVVYGHQPSASTQHMPAAGEACRAIKEREPGRKVLLLGGHVAALPDRTLREESADFVCDGEGPVTAVELACALGETSSDLSRVRGLWYRDEDGRVRSTAPAPNVAEVDREMPAVAWDLLPVSRYRAHNWHCFGGVSREPYAALYTTLGCPYRCTFCCIQAPFKRGESLLKLAPQSNSYRMWSPAAVVAQIDHLVETYGVKNIKIADEMFVLNPRHVHGVCDLLIERGHRLNIWAYARVDTIRDGMIEKLLAAGVRWIALGIEAADGHVRDEVDKGFTQERVYKTLEGLRAAGVNVIANYIFGLPEDTRETMQATLDLAMDLNTEFANFYSTMAYPGSPLYRTAIDLGWRLPDLWSGYSQHSKDTLPLPTKHLTAAEVLRFRDAAFHAYFESPRYLDMIGSRFGEETARQVRGMTAHRLERNHA
jgi:radical SAM superfamily enzyme YgiQ (UPF0313 family)